MSEIRVTAGIQPAPEIRVKIDVSGGAVPLDPSLSHAGAAAEAKAVGEALAKRLTVALTVDEEGNAVIGGL